ncbi:hypothetical protein N7462_010550 [Penicillium macrosclerotiorum]|uniref:uncharacterized protein n=1 Tax=Penicillium macrosclerotiorum TaxID=303699 RepID=UPI002548650F|nr:uncharacterized protein N7462_010550 [Penicillium macrosclerotiorum]KAJ5669480.1 hypothetical protein N7462_010550 [Penicillium macrosclerotiorum]
MTVSYGKKLRHRRSVFGLWIPTKVVAHRSKPNASPPDSAASDSPASRESIATGANRGLFRGRLTRSRSKILFFLGLGTFSNSKLMKLPKLPAKVDGIVDHELQAIKRAPDLTHVKLFVVQNKTKEYHPQPSSVYENDCCYTESESQSTTTSDNAQLNIAGTLYTSDYDVVSPTRKINAQLDGEDAPQSGIESDEGGSSLAAEAQSLSGLNLVDRVSQRLSVTFGHPTVVRRAHLRSRPSILFLDSPVTTSSSKQGDGANDSSDPSTTPSSNSSPVSYSTQSTPLTSGEPSPSSEKFKASHTEWSALPGCVADQGSSSGTKSPTITPSIVTVENAAVAKVYLELYFNSIFENLDPRVERQHELEQHIYAFQLSPEEQSAVRRTWAVQENEYLRQCRTLKTCMKSSHAVSIAGYEVIKVLGKGSFGVVRLVREKGNNKTTAADETSARDASTISSRGRHLEMLRSAVDGTRHSRRKFMTGEKKEVYAMKVIKKSDMIRNCQEGHIRAERDFLVASEKSRWVVPLITSFQDSSHLYLVMDYMVGGDFLGLLIRKDILHEEWTRFYIAEMVLCIEEAHRLCWIHRDVKPDNFLISASGHLKISDFGLAFNGHWAHDQTYYNNHRYSLADRLGIPVMGDVEDQTQAAEAMNQCVPEVRPQGLGDYSKYQVPSTDLLEWRNSKERRRFAKSVVGTSQYMAPEVIRGEMYDGRCDWWSLGIILYECLYGFTPFACENRHDTKIKILQHSKTLQFPREKPTDKLVSQDAIDLMGRILREREFRLCSQKYHANDMLTGRPVCAQFLYSMDPRYRNITSYWVYPNDAADIKAHPFFRDIRWNELHLSQPPLIPRVKNWEDTRYFDDWKTVGNINPEPENSDSSETEDDTDVQLLPGADPADSTAPPPPEQLKGSNEIAAKVPKAQKAENKREKKRPRDKILRDKKIGRAALEIRKRGAFLGYTYRRPKGPAMALSAERGRQPFVRGALTDLYAL